jgi:hypothetical protein
MREYGADIEYNTELGLPHSVSFNQMLLLEKFIQKLQKPKTLLE